MLVDTHCHIQSIGNKLDDFTAKKWHEGGVDNPNQVIKEAASAGVEKLICVGTDIEDSEKAVSFVQKRGNCYASVGVHPHGAKKQLAGGVSRLESLERMIQSTGKVVAIGEIGLDYHYEHSPREAQIKLFEHLLDLAAEHKLPVIFHVREAFDDFWPLLDNFKNIKGVVHSFSSDTSNLTEALDRGLYVGLNGIMTFTKDPAQLEAAKAVPSDRLLLETDAPYLAPKPFRGKVCKPEHVKNICEFLSVLRGENFDELARQTTANAGELFGLA